MKQMMNVCRAVVLFAAVGAAGMFWGWSAPAVGSEQPNNMISPIERGLVNILPGDLPNTGKLYVDHEAQGRSGHGGNTLAELPNGEIISFYSNTSGSEWGGHSVAGWSEYRRSTDGGKTWSEPYVLDYSKQAWEGDEMHSALVFAVEASPNGTLIATVVRFANAQWRKQDTPVYLLSEDGGRTWSEPMEFDADASVHDIALTFDTTFVHDDEVFIVFIGHPANMSPGPYTLWVSGDNGQSFEKRSTLPFHNRDYYSSAAVLPDGNIIVYGYPFRGGSTDEHNLPYVISEDGGRTWSDIETSHFAKKIRNPQMSDRVGDYYFMHGRSGSYGDESGHFVLYASTDGINWDEGIYITTRNLLRGGGDCYSANLVVGRHDPAVPERLLIQGGLGYVDAKVNIHHWWLTNIPGTEAK